MTLFLVDESVTLMPTKCAKYSLKIVLNLRRILSKPSIYVSKNSAQLFVNTL